VRDKKGVEFSGGNPEKNEVEEGRRQLPEEKTFAGSGTTRGPGSKVDGGERRGHGEDPDTTRGRHHLDGKARTMKGLS